MNTSACFTLEKEASFSTQKLLMGRIQMLAIGESFCTDQPANKQIGVLDTLM